MTAKVEVLREEKCMDMMDSKNIIEQQRDEEKELRKKLSEWYKEMRDW